MTFSKGPKASQKWKDKGKVGDAKEKSQRPATHILRDMKKYNPHLTRKQCIERLLNQLGDTEHDRKTRGEIQCMRRGRQFFRGSSLEGALSSTKASNVEDNVTLQVKEENSDAAWAVAGDADDLDEGQARLARSHVSRQQSRSKSFPVRALSSGGRQPVRFGLTNLKGSHMDRAKPSAASAGPPSGGRSRRGRAEDFFDSNTPASRTAELTAKDGRLGRRSRSRSPAARDPKRVERERSTSPGKGFRHKASGKRDSDDTRASGCYERNRSRDKERNRSRDRDRRYRSRSRDRNERRRDRSRSGERGRGGRGRDRYRDKGGDYERDRNEKRPLERASGRDGRHSPRRRGTSKPVSSRRSASPPPTNSPRHNIRIRSPSRKDDKRGNDPRKDIPIPSIEPPMSGAGANNDTMDISEDMGEEDEEDMLQRQMKAIMGFGNFNTTKNKQVPGNNVYGIRKEKKTEYRQYMNRVGGFNRPLSPS